SWPASPISRRTSVPRPRASRGLVAFSPMRKTGSWAIPWLVLVATNALAASKATHTPPPLTGPSGFVWGAQGSPPAAPPPAADFLLEHLSRVLFDPVDPTRIGSLDARLQSRVNGEIYRFADATTLERFRRNPARWCGILRDPVSGVRFIPDRF